MPHGPTSTGRKAGYIELARGSQDVLERICNLSFVGESDRLPLRVTCGHWMTTRCRLSTRCRPTVWVPSVGFHPLVSPMARTAAFLETILRRAAPSPIARFY